jgi:hypothetical protein
MLLLKSKKFWMIVGGLVMMIVITDRIERYIKCQVMPALTREEALQRSTRYWYDLSEDFSLDAESPTLSEERYDAERREWAFTFSNTTCTVIIITDRCQGTEVGGMSEGCTVRVKNRRP